MSSFNNISGVIKDVNVNKSNVFPILPSTIRDSRHLGTTLVRFSPTIVPFRAALVFVPSYQSQGWTISAHPEGNLYAHIKVPAGITMITEARIAEPGVTDQLNAWLSIICNMITEKHVHLPETSHLFLEIQRDSGSCNYYFADHALRTVFWLHTLDAVAVRPQDSFTDMPRHDLQHALEENYWIHVELFPETASKYSAAALNEIYDIFVRARADTLTSESPAFPHTNEECEGFIKSLERSKDHASSTLITTYVARLWVTVACHRSSIHFDSKRSPALIIVSKMLFFGFPEEPRARFKNLAVDQLVYTARWRKHISETNDDLKQEMSRILALLSADILMTQISSCPALAKLSLMLCIIGLAVTLVLLQEQRRRLVGTTATTPVVHLDDLITTYGFQLTAIVYSLPQALFVWALLLFAVQHFWMAVAGTSLTSLLSTFLLVAAVLLVACMGIWTALHPCPKYSRTPRYRCLRLR